MRRAMVLCLVVGSAAVISGTAGAALAGGGCHSGATKGTDPHIVIVDACFTPTITSVAPGTTVSFVNKDPFVHNVTANGWGHFDDLQQGDMFKVSFADEGIYPFACTYHPGMSGAIVVGDGNGPGNGSTAFVEENSDQPPAAGIAPVAADTSGASWLWIVAAGLIGLGAGSALTVGLTRTRKTQPAN